MVTEQNEWRKTVIFFIVMSALVSSDAAYICYDCLLSCIFVITIKIRYGGSKTTNVCVRVSGVCKVSMSSELHKKFFHSEVSTHSHHPYLFQQYFST